MDERTVVETRARIRAGPGTRLNDLYEIDALIAVGGMGEVFRGHVIETGDAVAIKTIRPDFAGHANALALFRKEAAALHTVHHGAVVRYYVFSVDRRLDLPYLAMEYVTGESLADRLKRGPLDFEAIEILRRRLAGGLQAAHEAGIIHRDVSPDNVILPGGDPARAKIIDFGIARSLTGQTVIGDGFAGKYSYVSPEQLGLQGGIVTGRSDIYSLGLVLAEANRGRPLDMGASPAEVIERRSAVPDLAGVDARLVPLISSMLQPDPQRRAGSMAEIEAWHPPAPRTAPPAPDGTGTRGRRIAFGAGAAGFLALAGAATFALLPSSPQRVPVPDTGPALSEAPAKAPATPPEERPTAKPSAPPEEQPAAKPPSKPPTSAPAPAAPSPPPADRAGEPAAPPASAPSGKAQEPARQEERAAPQERPPASEAKEPAKEPAQAPPAPQAGPRPSGMEQVAAFVRDYRGGTCFLLNPTTIGAREALVEGYGVNAQPFAAFDAAFKDRFGFEAKIQLRQIDRGQCPVVEALAAQAQAKPASAPKLKLDDDRIRSGGELRGTLDPGEARNFKLLLVEGDGTVHDLDPYLKRSGRQASFAIRLEKPANAGAQSQLLVAVTSREPLALDEAGRRSEAVFRAITREAARPDSGVGLAVRFIKVGS